MKDDERIAGYVRWSDPAGRWCVIEDAIRLRRQNTRRRRGDRKQCQRSGRMRARAKLRHDAMALAGIYFPFFVDLASVARSFAVGNGGAG